MNTYDIVGQDYTDDEDRNTPMTLDELLTLFKRHPKSKVKFIGTDYTIGNLMSWRGSYDLPALDYTSGVKTGRELFDQLEIELEERHTGYKGGKYQYSGCDQPYISQYGNSSEHMIVGYELDGNTLILLTKIVPY